MHIRANETNFMDKELNQAIMVRSKLGSKILKLRTEENRLAYAKQGKFCVKLLQQKSNITLRTLTLVVLLIKSYSGKQYLHFSIC